MPIVSSITAKVRTRANGSRMVWYEHTDHTGFVHRVASTVAAGEDEVENYRAIQEAEFNAGLPQWEATRFKKMLKQGGSPDAFSSDHMSPVQRLRAVLKAFIDAPTQHRAMKLAKWIDANVTATQIEAALGVQRKNKVQTSIARLLSMETSLDADASERGAI